MIKAGEKMSDKVVAFIKRNTTPTERKSFLPKHGYKSETINAVFRGDIEHILIDAWNYLAIEERISDRIDLDDINFE